MARLKVLLAAHACEPYKGSEPGIGWHTALEIAREHDVWVLTAEYHRPAIERYLREHPVPGLTFEFIDAGERMRRWIEDVNLVTQVHYYVWLFLAMRVARRLSREVAFDVAHHVSYVRCWSPSCLVTTGLPLVWGPIAGAEPAPFSLVRSFGARGALFDLTRRAAIAAGRIDPLVRLTAKRSVVAFVASPSTGRYVEALGTKAYEVLSPTLAPEDALALEAAAPSVSPILRLVSIGRLVAWKGHHLALQALAASGLRDFTYDIVGTGIERRRLERLARRLGLRDRVAFHDVSRQRMLELLSAADIVLHPAVHDPGPTAVLEAMAASKPVICLDMEDGIVVPEVGVPVPLGPAEETVGHLATAIRRLADDPELRAAMGGRARDRVERELRWSSRGTRYEETYRRIAGRAGSP